MLGRFKCLKEKLRNAELKLHERELVHEKEAVQQQGQQQMQQMMQMMQMIMHHHQHQLGSRCSR